MRRSTAGLLDGLLAHWMAGRAMSFVSPRVQGPHAPSCGLDTFCWPTLGPNSSHQLLAVLAVSLSLVVERRPAQVVARAAAVAGHC